MVVKAITMILAKDFELGFDHLISFDISRELV
jgi:hypothetical protein